MDNSFLCGTPHFKRLCEVRRGYEGWYSDFEDVHVMEYIYSRLSHINAAPELIARAETRLVGMLDDLLVNMRKVFGAWLYAHMGGGTVSNETPLTPEVVLEYFRQGWRQRLADSADDYLEEFEESEDGDLIWIDGEGYDEEQLGYPPEKIAAAFGIDVDERPELREEATQALLDFFTRQAVSDYGEDADALAKAVSGEDFVEESVDRVLEMYLELTPDKSLRLHGKWQLMTRALGVAHNTGDMHEHFGMDEDDFRALNHVVEIPDDPEAEYRRLGNGDVKWGEIFWLDELAGKFNLDSIVSR